MVENRKKYKYLFVNIIAFLFGNIGTKLISFLMVPLYTNILLPEEYGEIDLILSVAGVILPFIACGIHEGVMRFCLDKNSNHKLVFSIGMRVFLLSSLVLLVLTPLLNYIPLISNNAYFIFLYCFLNEFMTIVLCYIRGKDNIKLYSFLGFLSAFLTSLLNVIFLVVLKLGLDGYKMSMLISPVLTSIISIFIGKLIPDFSIKKWDKTVAKDMLRYSLILIPNSLLWWCINASDRFFVSYICGNAENGLYAAAYKIPTLLSTISTIFVQAWQMSAIKNYEDDKSDESFSEIIYKQLIFISGLSTLILLITNRLVLSFYVGNEYFEAWKYSPPLMISFFFEALGSFWGVFYIAAKKMKKYLYSAIAGAFTNTVLNFILIIKFGTIGAAIATAISYIIIFIFRSFGICKENKIKVFNLQLVSSFICLTIGLISSYLKDNLLLWLIGIINIVIYLLLNKKFILDTIRTIINITKKIKLKSKKV